MKLELQETSDTLAGFFPDPALRGEAHRAFVHRFLSPYMHGNPWAFFAKFHGLDADKPPPDPARVIQSLWGMFEERAGLAPPPRPGSILFRRVTDLTADPLNVENYPAVLVTLPPPEVRLACSHALTVLLHPGACAADWPREARARFFTLERVDEKDNGAGFACEWTREGSHANYGGLQLGDRDGFLALAAARLRAGEPQPAARGPAPQPGSRPGPQPAPRPAAPNRKPWWRFW